MTTEQKNEIREFVQTLEDKPFEKHTIGDIARLRASCKRLIKALEAAETLANALEKAANSTCWSCLHNETSNCPDALWALRVAFPSSKQRHCDAWCFDIMRFSEVKDNERSN